MSNRILILFISLVLLNSCGSKKKVVSPTAPEEKVSVVNSVTLNNIDYSTFSGKAKAKVKFEEDQHSVNISMRIKKDEQIWISVTAMLGIEVARVLITPNRIQIMNRLHGEYIDKPFDYIYKYTSEVLTFASLQDVLIANVSTDLLQSADVDVAKSDTDIKVMGKNEDLLFYYTLTQENKPQALQIVQAHTQESLKTQYLQYTDFSGYVFPKIYQIVFDSKNHPVEALLEYGQIQFNEVLEFPFSVPSRYKRIE